MRKLVVLLGLFFTQVTFAQNYVHQVLVLNEGYFDFNTNQIIVPPTIGSYNPLTQVYITVDTLSGARFASDMILEGDYIYVAADNTLYQYDKFTMNVINTQQIDGIRNLAIWNDKIIVTRGDYDNITFMPILFESYLQIFNSSDLSFFSELDTISGPKWATQNMIVDGDILYVAINNAYEWGNEKGLVGVLDMSTMYYMDEIDLGPDGKNPDNMMFDGTHLYTVNNKDWSGSSISKIDLSTSINTTINMSQVSTGCGTSCLRDNKIVYQVSGDTDLYAWDPVMMPNYGNSLGFTQNFYDLEMDNINNYLYASSTDFFSYGMIEIYDSNNTIIGNFSCGISPGTIAFDIRSNISGLSETYLDSHLNGEIYDIFGRKLLSLEDHPYGIYIVNGKKIYKSKK